MGRKNENAVRAGCRDMSRHEPIPGRVCQPCGGPVSRADLSAARRTFGTPTPVCSGCRRAGSVEHSRSVSDVDAEVAA